MRRKITSLAVEMLLRKKTGAAHKPMRVPVVILWGTSVSLANPLRPYTPKESA